MAAVLTIDESTSSRGFRLIYDGKSARGPRRIFAASDDTSRLLLPGLFTSSGSLEHDESESLYRADSLWWLFDRTQTVLWFLANGNMVGAFIGEALSQRLLVAQCGSVDGYWSIPY